LLNEILSSAHITVSL